MFNNSATGRKEAFWDDIITNKLYSPKVWLFLLSVSVMFSYLVCVAGMRGAILAGGIIVGLPMAVAIIAYPKFGIVVFTGSFLPVILFSGN